MMFPKDGQYLCNKCGATRSIDKSQHFTTDAKEKKMTVITESSDIRPKTTALCSECGHKEAHFDLKQTRSADEPETRIFTCCKCRHTWREY
jgi:DNA-directed RNA polymerase subunit M